MKAVVDVDIIKVETINKFFTAESAVFQIKNFLFRMRIGGKQDGHMCI